MVARTVPNLVNGSRLGLSEARPWRCADVSICLEVAGAGIVNDAVTRAIVLIAGDPPPLKWSDLRYVFDIKEDCNGKEAIQA